MGDSDIKITSVSTHPSLIRAGEKAMAELYAKRPQCPELGDQKPFGQRILDRLERFVEGLK